MEAIHQHHKSLVSRNQVSTRLYALSEQDMPKGRGLPQDLLEIAKFLAPETSPRYDGKAIYSHIYAYDFCYLAGCYLPRVWHRDVNNADAGICDMRAIDQYYWLKEFGFKFGWREIVGEDQAKELAEVGHVVVISALPKSNKSHGGISIVMPEIKPNFHRRTASCLAQTRAGKEFFYSDWYKNGTFGNHKMYVNYLK